MTRYRDPFNEPYSWERPSRSDTIDSQAQPSQTPVTQRTGAIATPVDRSLGDRHVIHHDSVDYNAGFIQGRAIEHQHMVESLRARDEENTVNGLLAGILLTSLLALGIGTAYFWSQRNNTPRTIERTIVVPSPVPTTAPVQVVPVPNTGTTQQTAPTGVQPSTQTGGQSTAPTAPTTNSSSTTTTPTTGTQSSGATQTGTP